MDATVTFRGLAREFRRLLPDPNAKKTVWVSRGECRQAKTLPTDVPDSLYKDLRGLSRTFMARLRQTRPKGIPKCRTFQKVRQHCVSTYPGALPYPAVELTPDIASIKQRLGRSSTEEQVLEAWRTELEYSAPPGDLPEPYAYMQNAAAVCDLMAELVAEPPETQEELLKADPLRWLTECQRYVLLALLFAHKPIWCEGFPEPMERAARTLGIDFLARDASEIRKKVLPLLRSCGWISGKDGRRGVRLTDRGEPLARLIAKQEQDWANERQRLRAPDPRIHKALVSGYMSRAHGKPA